MTAGNVSDVKAAPALLERAGRMRYLLADKGYDADRLRRSLRDAGAVPVIPDRLNRKRAIRYDKDRYRVRHLIENAFYSLKDFRRVATLYDKLAATMPELAARLLRERQVAVHPASLSRFLKAAEFTVKKMLLASEAGRDDVARARRTWRSGRQPRMRQEPHRLVFVDETATTTKMVRLRGRARRGQRLKTSALFGRWGTQTFIAGLRCDGLSAPWLIDRQMNRDIFETRVETQLAPTLSRGDIVILDNLSSGKSPKAAAILKQRGA
ncbi:transposase [Sphingomonas sp. SORGH_AS 950]|nr:transposase [Sphingomonas sp. SORGH_AS_0950]